MPQKGKRCFSSLKVHTDPGAHQASYSVGTGVFTGVKRSGCVVDHSCPFSVVVKNEWSYTSTPSVCRHGVTGTTLCSFPLNWCLFYSGSIIEVIVTDI